MSTKERFSWLGIGLLVLVLAYPVTAQKQTINAVDPITKFVVDLGEMPALMRLLHDDQVKTQNILRSLTLTGSLNRTISSTGDALNVWVRGSTYPDPCATAEKIDAAISQTASTRIIVGQPAKRIAICQIRLVAGAAEITSELEGTGTTCGTGTIAHSGSTTAANGESFAANGGYQSGSGIATIMITRPGVDFCIGQSGSSRVSGKATYVYTY